MVRASALVEPRTWSVTPGFGSHPPSRPLLLYDGDCRFCCWAARVIARLDRDEALAFLPLRDPRARSLLESLPSEEHLTSWRLISPAGTPVGYGTGARELLGAMRFTRPLAQALRLVPDRVLDSCYRFVAGQRTRLGRLVPDRRGPSRFP